MPCEGHLGGWREDPDLRVPALLGRVDEDCLVIVLTI
jgi:hypothetical protein